MLAAEIHKGDHLMVTGPTTGIVTFDADEIRYDMLPVEKAEKGQRISIKVPEKIRPSDKLFKIVKVSSSDTSGRLLSGMCEENAGSSTITS